MLGQTKNNVPKWPLTELNDTNIAFLFYLCRIKHDRSSNDLGPSVGTENGCGPRLSTNLTDLPEVNQGTHVLAPTTAKKLPLLNSEITGLNYWKLMKKS